MDVLLALDYTRTRDQRQRLASTDVGADWGSVTQSACENCLGRARSIGLARPIRCLCAAPIKAANSGWGSIGLDLNSGWNWHPRNHGWSGISQISTYTASGVCPVRRKPPSVRIFSYSRLNSWRAGPGALS